MPVAAELTVNVIVPQPWTEFVFNVAVRPGEGETVRVTLFANPLTGAIVILELPERPGTTGPAVVGLADMMKSTIVTLKVSEWDKDPLLPVMVTL